MTEDRANRFIGLVGEISKQLRSISIQVLGLALILLSIVIFKL
jgi:hypothetical protein